jgi:hypothetical protein
MKTSAKPLWARPVGWCVVSKTEFGEKAMQNMRNGQNKRMRGRSNNNNNNNNRKSSNPLTRVYESNGPDVKIRGSASHVAEKYIQLARDAQTSGDPVAAENYYQHAEHYFRMIATAQEQFRQGQQPFNRPEGGEQQRDESFDDGDDENQGHPMMGGGEPGYGNREPPPQQQPYPPRDNQFQPREHQHQSYNNHRDQQPQHNREQQPYPPRDQQPRPPQQGGGGSGDSQADVAGLPSFITGSGSQQPPAPSYGPQNGHEGQGQADRYPLHRRRRRHRGSRNDMAGGGPPGDNLPPRPTNE